MDVGLGVRVVLLLVGTVLMTGLVLRGARVGVRAAKQVTAEDDGLG